MEIAGKTLLVSGGASGLGAATVRRLAELGAAVVIADLNAAEGERLAHHLGPQGIFVATDVTDEAAVQSAVATALERFGGLHGAVSCAGIGVAEKVLSRRGVHALDSFRRVIEINLVGTFNVIRLAAAALAQNEPDPSGERGVIVNTASVAAFDGQVGQAAYAASKGGIVGMTLPIARDLGPLGIRVVTIAPGIFETPLMAGLPEAAQASVLQQTVFPQRFGRPAEFAALVTHIIENQMLNGEVIRLDGAIRMGAK
jgi:NAD(P)-dependent dehydrogenase (short-subunit alcohol dehydrogenase family)